MTRPQDNPAISPVPDEVLLADERPAPAMLVPARHFCSSCGASWQTDWQECPNCAAQSSAASTTSPLELRALRGPLFLYFLLLGVSIVGMIAVSQNAAV